MAQDLENIGKEKPISFSGGLSINQIFYSSHGLSSRRDPYNLLASGNLDLNIYGWSIPLTFSASKYNSSFTQPFNHYSIHPSWKWVTVHAGFTSMSFSPYSVNGHIFSGAAIELSPPGKWRFSALYGRFLKAVPGTINSQPSFQRMGYAVKAGFGDSRNFLDLTLFHAEDDKLSIPAVFDSLPITPHENLVVSIAGGKSIYKHVVVKGEFATTAITRDTRSEITGNRNLLAKPGFLFQPRLSSSFYKAIKTSLDYHHDGWRIGCSYEYIDPGYQTLGAYYFNNDLENVAVNGTTSLLKDKLNVTLTAGIQRDNLDKAKISTMRRMVSSVNINYAVLQKLNVSVSWSSFQTYTNIRSAFETINQLTPYDHLDTLNFTQISRNASATGVYTLSGNDPNRKHLNMTLTWQSAAGEGASAAARFYNLSTGYSVAMPSHNTSLSLTFNANAHQGDFMTAGTLGPSASVSKSYFRRKMRMTLSSSWNTTHNNGSSRRTQFNARLSCASTVLNNHNLSVSFVFVKRKSESASTSAKEFTGTIGYNYSFGSRKRQVRTEPDKQKKKKVNRSKPPGI